MTTLAYVIRHGSTDKSPQPEWQSQIPLNALGQAQALDAAEFIRQKCRPLPKWGVSSDLARAVETLNIASQALRLEVAAPMADLRALDKDEDQKDFEKRNRRAFESIIRTGQKAGVPVIACHRSNTAFLGKEYGYVCQPIDYRQASLIWEGGVIRITTRGVEPMYKQLSENPKEDIGQPSDGTHISGFVTDEDNAPPRECSNCRWRPMGFACKHPVVTVDDELGIRYGKVRNVDGHWLVGDRDCCNSFQNKIGGR